MGCGARHGCAHVAVVLSALLALPWHRPSVTLPTYYQEPLDLIFSRGKTIMKAKGRPVRIQLLDDLDTANFLAAIATRSLKNKPKGRCAIVVRDQNVARATCEKLLESEVAHQLCCCYRHRFKLDPSKSVTVCTISNMKVIFGQSFDIKAIGFAPPIRPATNKAQNKAQKITAGLHIEVAPAFYGLNVDYIYTMEQAHAEGRVAALKALVMPLKLPDGSDEIAEVSEACAKVIQQHAEWAPMVIFLTKRTSADSCTAVLQRNGISAARLPIVETPGRYFKDEGLVQDYFKKLTEGELQVVCTCQTRLSTFLPDSVRSIVLTSKHRDAAWLFPNSLFTALRTSRERRSCFPFIHIIYNNGLKDGFFFLTRRASRACTFYFDEMPDCRRESQKSHQLAGLDEIATRFDKSEGATLELLKPQGQIVPMTEENVKEIIDIVDPFSDDAKLLCDWLQSQKRIPRQKRGTVEGDRWKTWHAARQMLEGGKMSAETKRLLSRVSSVDVIPTMQKQIASLRRERKAQKRKTDLS